MREGKEQKSEDGPQRMLSAEGNESDKRNPNCDGGLNEEEH